MIIFVDDFFDAEEESPTLENFKNSLMKTMITQMLNMRLSDLTKKEDPDFIYAGSYNAGRFIRPKNMFAVYGGVQESKIEIGFKSLVRELERIIRFGFIENDFEFMEKCEFEKYFFEKFQKF